MLIRQVKFAFDLLEFFAVHRSPATLTEISEHFRWPRSSTFNLIETLSAAGYLHEPRVRGGYYPTRRLLSLGTVLAEHEPVPTSLVEAVRALADTTGETCILGAISGQHAIYLNVVESRESIRYIASAGDTVPLYATAIGRALISLMSEREVDVVIRQASFQAYADNTPTDEHALRAMLADVKMCGYSLNDNGYQPHLLGVAVPFELQGWRLALMVAGPSARMRDNVNLYVSLILERLRNADGITKISQ